ncbi:MAG: alkaline phosphatase family protein [Aliarcobacter sp.]|jgi:hypothetical protein
MKACVFCLDGFDPNMAFSNDIFLPYNGYTCIPLQYSSPMAWIEFATGIPAEKNGITGYHHPNGREWNNLDLKVASYWWDSFPCKVGVMDIPIVTSPSSAINGWMCGGYGDYPESIWPNQHFFVPPRYTPVRFPGGNASFRWDHIPTEEEIIERMQNFRLFAKYNILATTRSIELLLKKYHTDILIVYHGVIDEAGHLFRGWNKPFLCEVYKWVEQMCSIICSMMNTNNMIVVSDHGMLPLEQDENMDIWNDMKVLDGTLWYREVYDKQAHKKQYVLGSGGHVSKPYGVFSSNLPNMSDINNVTYDMMKVGSAISNYLTQLGGSNVKG